MNPQFTEEEGKRLQEVLEDSSRTGIIDLIGFLRAHDQRFLAHIREEVERRGSDTKHEKHKDDKSWCYFCGQKDMKREVLALLT